MPTEQRRPTPRMLAHLKRLAERTGMTFAYPRTFAQARVEIQQLERAERSSRYERRADREAVDQGLAGGPASSVQPDEVEGYGSNCRWSHRTRDE